MLLLCRVYIIHKHNSGKSVNKNRCICGKNDVHTVCTDSSLKILCIVVPQKFLYYISLQFTVPHLAWFTGILLSKSQKKSFLTGKPGVGWILRPYLFGWSVGLCWLAHQFYSGWGHIRVSGATSSNEVTATPWYEVSSRTGLHNKDSRTLWNLQPL